MISPHGSTSYLNVNYTKPEHCNQITIVYNLIRRDLDDSPKLEWKHEVSPRDFYLSNMDIFRSKWNNFHLIIISSLYLWCTLHTKPLSCVNIFTFEKIFIWNSEFAILVEIKKNPKFWFEGSINLKRPKIIHSIK